MKKNLSPLNYFLIGILASAFLSGCANRNKADIIDTSTQNTQRINSDNGESVGVREKEFVLQRKKNLAEELRSLENKVRELDDRVYGTRDYDTYGLWGQLRDCREKLPNKNSDYDGGPLERMSDDDYLLNWKANSDAKAGIEKSSEKLVALSEEDLDDHIKKLNKTKVKLEKKEDEVRERLIRCKSAGK